MAFLRKEQNLLLTVRSHTFLLNVDLRQSFLYHILMIMYIACSSKQHGTGRIRTPKALDRDFLLFKTACCRAMLLNIVFFIDVIFS